MRDLFEDDFCNYFVNIRIDYDFFPDYSASFAAYTTFANVFNLLIDNRHIVGANCCV